MTPHALQLLIENEEDSAVFNGEYVQPIAELKKRLKVSLNRVINY